MRHFVPRPSQDPRCMP